MLPVTALTSRRLGRIVCGVLVSVALLGPPSAFAAPQPPAPVPTAQPTVWAVTLDQVTLYSAPSDQASSGTVSRACDTRRKARPGPRAADDR